MKELKLLKKDLEKELRKSITFFKQCKSICALAIMQNEIICLKKVINKIDTMLKN